MVLSGSPSFSMRGRSSSQRTISIFNSSMARDSASEVREQISSNSCLNETSGQACSGPNAQEKSRSITMGNDRRNNRLGGILFTPLSLCLLKTYLKVIFSLNRFRVATLAIYQREGYKAVTDTAIFTLHYINHSVLSRPFFDASKNLGMAHFASVPYGVFFV